MKGLILKDIYGIRITQKTYILLFLFLCIFGYIMKSPGYVGVMCIVVFATSILSLFNADQYYIGTHMRLPFLWGKRQLCVQDIC